jgi:capsular exopolysaccharide synthesis family protein
MSRIEEALRRAAAQGQTGTGTENEPNHVPEPVEGVDVATLALEPFPMEVVEHRRPRAAVVPAPVPRPRDTRESQSRDAEPHESESRHAEDAGGQTGGNRREGNRLFDRVDAGLAEKVVIDENMSPTSREQYRRLAAVLHDAQGSTGLRVLMIASAVPGEGKTLTAANLALTLSESYRNRVMLIDADLRRPTLHTVFRLRTSSGLIEGLEGPPDAKLIVRQVTPRLAVLPAGRPTMDPMAALTSSRMRRLVDEAKEAFDWVILDTPPLTLLPDAHLLSPLVDAAVLVVRANSTPHALVKRASDIIGRQRIAGVVLNRAEAPSHVAYSDYSHGYYLADDHKGQATR